LRTPSGHEPHRKTNTMDNQLMDNRLTDEQPMADPVRSDETAARGTSHWAERVTTARAEAWSSDRVLDPGDTHDKGEASLCVGEAA